jgi:hypothetical protein
MKEEIYILEVAPAVFSSCLFFSRKWAKVELLSAAPHRGRAALFSSHFPKALGK